MSIFNWLRRWLRNTSIQRLVIVFFIVNGVLVLVNYSLTVYSNNQSIEDEKYLQVSKENENLLQRIEYLLSSILGGDVEFKESLKDNVQNYESNLNALKNGGVAFVRKNTNTNNQLKIKTPYERSAYKIKELEDKWQNIKEQMVVINQNPVFKDDSVNLNQPVKQPEISLSDTNSDTVDFSFDSTEIRQINEINDLNVTRRDSINKTTGQVVRNQSDISQNNTQQKSIVKRSLNPDVEKAYNFIQTNIDDISTKNFELSNLYQKNLVNSQVNFQSVLLFTMILNLFTLLLGSAIIITNVVNPLKKISSTAKEVATGDVVAKVEYDSTNEIGEVASSLNLVVNNFKQYTEFADNVGKGNFNFPFEVNSEKDILGFTLLNMRDSLKKVADEDSKRNWANEGFAKFGNILRASDKDPEELSYEIISNLVKYVDANQGGIFLLAQNGSKNSEYLELKAGFAYNKRKYQEKKIHLGQGLLGQTVLEKQSIQLSNIPQDYLRITSGLGETNPKNLLIVPLSVNEDVFGAMEIASLNPLDPHKVDFVERLSENIASTLASVKTSENTKTLLRDSQQSAEQLRAQEEEMRQNMEELETTQEEMRRNQLQLEEYKNNLEQKVGERTQQLKEKEKELSEAFVQLKEIMESSTAGIVAINNKYEVILANTKIKEFAKEFYGAELKQGQNWFDIYNNEDDKRKARAFWNQALSGQDIVTEEIYGDESLKRSWFETSLSPIESETADIIGASMFMRNITSRKESQKYTERNAKILDNSTNEVYLFDAKTFKFTEVNERGRNNLGYSEEELMELTPYEIEPRFDRVGFEQHIEPLKNGEVDNMLIETTYHRKDGSTYDIELNLQLFSDDETPVYAAIVQDITERKRNEQELQEAVERFNLATAATNEGVWEMSVVESDPINPDNEAWWSPRFKALLGFNDFEFPNKLDSWSSRLHPEDREPTLRAFYEHLIDKTGETPYQVEYRLYTKWGDYLWFSATAGTKRNEFGAPVRVAGTLRNIDRRKKAEQDLKQQTATVEGILNAAVNSIISIDANGTIMSVNPATGRIFGYADSELIGSPAAILISEDLRELTGKTVEIKSRRKDGEELPVDVSISQTQVEDSMIYVGILRDATARKKKEEEAKMAEERMRKFLDATSEGIVIHEQGTIKDVNPALCEMLGYTADEMVGTNLMDYMSEESAKIVSEKIKTYDEEPYEVTYKNKDGNTIKVEAQGRNIEMNGVHSRIVSIRNISESAKAAYETFSRQLSQADELLESLINNVSGMFFRCNADSEWSMAFVSKGAEVLTGYNPDEFTNQKGLYDSLTDAKQRDKVWSTIQGALLRKEKYSIDYTIKTAQRETKKVRERGYGIYKNNGELQYLEGFITEIPK
ncbi:PAS domain S-box protein [Microscilla marina]|uniref:PAS domain S-box protein n=1 Tax=Microscilla marina TaxID=1027 RepID=UPI0009E4985F|nr:PAS domain S-box protein [Microscilla marina]